MVIKCWAVIIVGAILAGCGNPLTGQSLPPSPYIEQPTSTPRSTESDDNGTGGAAQPSMTCDTESLRAALDEGGERFLQRREESGAYFYDSFQVEKCGASFAVVQANHTSGSSFNYFALKRGQDAWYMFAVASVRSTTPETEPLTWHPEPGELGGDWDVFVEEMGPTIGQGRPIQ